LGVERLDIYFIHGLGAEHYPAARDRFRPLLEKAKQAGKIRLYGLTEGFERDTSHVMLRQAVAEGGWDVFMVGYNLVNQSALERVLKPAREKGIATLGMFAVRRGLIEPELLRKVLGRLVELGEIDPILAQEPDLMTALGLRGHCASLVEAAYRFCAYEPALDVVLVGTGSSAHLADNLRAVEQGPLPAAVINRLRALFSRVEGVSAQVRD
jgi:aryl-alcohol dehydrogenase-like predicted oxidoreductase